VELALTLSLLIGVALGLLGGGGSILTVPVLTYALHLEPKAAIATSLLVVAATSLAAVIPHALAGRVSFRIGAGFGVTGMVGAYAGGRLAAFLPGELLLGGFALMMVATGVAMLRARDPELADGSADVSTGERAPARISRIAAHGLGVGLVTGLVGAGGGFLIVPSLVLLGGMGTKPAIATSLLVIAMKSLAGFAGYAGHVPIDVAIVGPVTIFAVLGSAIGVLISRKVQGAQLRRAFAWFVLAMSAVVALQLLPGSVQTAMHRAVLVDRWPAWASGVAIAAVVVGLLYVDNRQLGVSTGYAELCRLPKEPALRSSWRPKFVFGIVLGGALSALASGAGPSSSMGSFDVRLHGNVALEALVLLLGGVLLGFGARLAGGCTSGHGIVGTALGARSSWVATALFMIGGFVTTRLILV
jgi:uncharacterized membrane protein YfcA/uncharacterized membrane protein YedE/YeeE